MGRLVMGCLVMVRLVMGRFVCESYHYKLKQLCKGAFASEQLTILVN